MDRGVQGETGRNWARNGQPSRRATAISGQVSNGMTAKIKAAQQSLVRDNVCAALSELNALQNLVNAQAGKQISVEAANLINSYLANLEQVLRSSLG
jgi:hypothetical protein